MTLSAVTLLCIPVAREPATEIAAFLPGFGVAVILIELATGYLLFGQFIVSRLLPAAILGCAYFFTGLIVIPHLLVFPGVFAPGGLLGAGAQSAVWLWVFWHGGFPALVAVYAFVERMAPAPIPAARIAVVAAWLGGAVVALVAGLAALATLGHDLLPVIVARDDYLRLIRSGVGPIVGAINVLALLLVVLLLRCRTLVQLWLAVALLASTLDVTLTLAAQARYTLGWYMARVNSLFAAGLVLAAMLHEMTVLYARMLDMRDRLRLASVTDALTGLANRRQFDETLLREWRRERRTARPIGLLMIDIDKFKAYNDTLGHPAGDACLKRVADAIASVSSRAGDLAARYGGEEFSVILPETDIVGAYAYARRLMEAVRAINLPHPEGIGQRVSVSVGVAACVPDPDRGPGELIAAADAALYRAKRAGRDRASE